MKYKTLKAANSVSGVRVRDSKWPWSPLSATKFAYVVGFRVKQFSSYRPGRRERHISLFYCLLQFSARF